MLLAGTMVAKETGEVTFEICCWEGGGAGDFTELILCFLIGRGDDNGGEGGQLSLSFLRLL